MSTVPRRLTQSPLSGWPLDRRDALPVSFAIEVRPARDRVIVVPAGELDLVTCAVLSSEVRTLLDDGFAHVVVDLRELTFMGSSGIHTLLACSHHADRL